MSTTQMFFDWVRETVDAVLVDLRFLKESYPELSGTHDVRQLLMYDHDPK